MTMVRQMACLAAGAAAAGCVGVATAGGFGILAQSGSALGSAFAGAAAVAEDATTVWYNPAGMGRLEGFQASSVLHVVKPSFRFRDAGSSGAFAAGGDGGDGGGWAPLLQGYAVWSSRDDLRLGVGFNTPFGLATRYDRGWQGQLTALKSEAAAYNLNPSIAVRLAPGTWVGAGINLQRFGTTLTNFSGPLGEARLQAHDMSWGFNLGAAFDATEHTRVGIAYRSPIRYRLKGDARFSAGAGVFDSGVEGALTVPETVSIGTLTRLDERWELMTGATWTRWSRLQSLQVVRTTASALGPAGSIVTTLPFGWRNTVLLAVGASVQASDTWKFRFGLAHDPAVSNDATRNARLPDQARTLVTIGARLTPTSGRWTHDFALGHEFIRLARVNNTVPGAPGVLAGSFRSSANVITWQANYRL